MITKGERTELRSIVRQQFKVLRSELEQREMEMQADIEQEIASRFAVDDESWSVVQHKVNEAILEANRRVNDALYEAGYEKRGSTERQWVGHPRMEQPQQSRNELRVVAASRVRAQVRAAKLRLERDEADLLRNLAVGVIESEEAREFLSAIPTVGELVPVARLAEIEASLSNEDDRGGSGPAGD